MMRPGEVRDALRTLRGAGLLAPHRPDRLVRAAGALRRWGPTAGAGVAATAALHPERVAIVDPAGALTWSELDARTNGLAHALARLGVDAATVVGVLCRNHRGFVEATVAASRLGADVVFLNTAFATPQLRDVVEREAIGALLHDEEFAGMVEEAGPPPVTVVTWGAGRDAVRTTNELVATSPADPPPKPPRVPRTIVLTSGTTGAPKGAARGAASPIGGAIGLLDRIPYHTDETTLIPAPLFHAWGLGNLTLGVALGATLVLPGRFEPEGTLALIDGHRAGCLVAVPVMLRRILDLPVDVRRRYDTSSLRIVPLSGSAIPTGLAEQWMDAFGDNLYNLYGSTEVGWATVATPEDLRAAPGTAGRPPLRTVVHVLDAAGREVAPGTTGRIFVGNDLLFDGYTGGGGKEVLGGLMSTGDNGHFDPDGRLFVEGRDDEMIVSGGENVFPREVEDCLAVHPAVVEAAVVGVSDEEWGQRLRAFVVRRDDVEFDAFDADAARAHVKASLARFKVPRDVVFVPELPRNPAGKVLKRELTADG